MTNRRKQGKKKIAFIALVMFFTGIGKNYMNITDASLDVVQEVATIANTPTSDATQEIGATEAPLDAEYIKDENILESTYYSYGKGCLFVSIEKENEQLVDEDSETTTVSDGAVQGDVSTGAAISNGMENTGIVSSTELVKACFTKEEQRALINGENKELRIFIRNKNENDVNEDVLASIEDAVEFYRGENEGFSFGDYISFVVKKKNAEGKWEKIKKFNSGLRIYLDIPKHMQIETGSYCLISVHGDEKELLEDANSYGNVLTFSLERSAVYGLACVIPVEGEEEVVSEPVAEQSAFALFWERMNNEKFCLWHWFDISVLIIGMTWVAAINSKKKRTIFFGIMSVIAIVLAIMGHCEFDWPFAIVTILIMLVIHLWKWYCQRKEEQDY